MDGGLVDNIGDYIELLVSFFVYNSSRLENKRSFEEKKKVGARLIIPTKDEANDDEVNELAPLNIPYLASETLVALVAVVGNALVIAAFCTNEKLRAFRNYHIISLAVADFLVGAVGIPLAVMASFGLPRDLNGCLLSVSTLLVLCTASIFCLVAVSVDRFWAAVNPLEYHRRMSNNIANGMILTCWLLSIVIGGLPLFGWHNYVEWEAKNECKFGQIISYNYLTFLYFGTTVLPAILLMGFYGYVYYIIHDRFQQRSKALRRRSRISKLSGNPMESFDDLAEADKTRETRAAAKLGSIVVFFMICWMPLHTINCLKGFQVALHIPHWIMEFTIVLSHANSALNPILYGYYLKDFRHGMKNVLLTIFGIFGLLQCQKVDMNEARSRTWSPRSIITKESR